VKCKITWKESRTFGYFSLYLISDELLLTLVLSKKLKYLKNATAEKIVGNTGTRPHLGKYCENIDSQDLKRLHGEHFERFRQQGWAA
jgi:hypothetical protein